MASPTEEVAELAAVIRETQAGANLPPAVAKLYSQHTRVREQQQGLTSWSEGEADERFKDAVRLLEVASIERESDSNHWRDPVRRAGELLEWLSHPGISSREVPTRLLAAAAYQLAGYPARATGLLRDDIQGDTESYILSAFLKADFPELQQLLLSYWQWDATLREAIKTPIVSWGNDPAPSEDVQNLITRETVAALGVLCAEMRWGGDSRLQGALDKLATLSKVLIHFDHPHSWLLARLCGDVAVVYAESSLRTHLALLADGVSESGCKAFERYARQNYLLARSLAWSSQVRGIERLQTGESFALCTPTGSGKTAVAEIAILQSLFSERLGTHDQEKGMTVSAPLTLYLVPSRALATEVETKLSRVLKRVDREAEIVVTGLYGGTDWGPTDAWLTTSKRTVLICTYEKAEALIRFLGPLFLSRVMLVVMDEAHSIQFDGNSDTLRNGDNRSLRLEAVGSRLLAQLERNGGRFIALSAVAAGVENVLARWATGRHDAVPAKTDYRSTRQLIGRLECLPNRAYEIHYDLLDGASLQFDDREGSAKPYIRSPFPPSPATGEKKSDSIAKKLRSQLLWAAMHLAKPDDKGQQRAVLISITEQIAWYTNDFLKFLTSEWTQNAPQFFSVPKAPEKLDTWNRCLQACEDYYGLDSTEYKLLERGIVVHHGKMPGLMARLLVEIVEKRIVHIVVATSTLSEGVNLPFETVLIPSLRRWNGNLSAREFGNLVGRAGRPGYGTEGRSLVVLPLGSGADARQITQMRNLYALLIKEIEKGREAEKIDLANSPVAALMVQLYQQWQRASRSEVLGDFLKWLEQTAPLKVPVLSEQRENDEWLPAVESLDTLDAFLLSVIVEAEQLEAEELTPAQVEERLKQIWQRSYAHYASKYEARLSDFFVVRGRALYTGIYPDASERRRLYRTSVPPRSGVELLNSYQLIRELLKTGDDYARRDPGGRFAYIEQVVERVTSLSKFKLTAMSGRDKGLTWRDVLRWWLDPQNAPTKPDSRQVANWHNYATQNFGYKFNWGLGSILALAFDESHQGVLRETSLDEWSDLGLPWAVFWLKELLVWGTLEPVAAFILSQGGAPTRKTAEEIARRYYEDGASKHGEQVVDELLNAKHIRDWWLNIADARQTDDRPSVPYKHEVNLLRDFSNVPLDRLRWRVLPIEVDNAIHWLDPAGFVFASCPKFGELSENLHREFDFTLDVDRAVVEAEPYL